MFAARTAQWHTEKRFVCFVPRGEGTHWEVAEGELVTQRINLNGARHLAQLVHGGYLRNSAAHAHVTLRVTEKMQQQNDVIFSVTR